MDGWKDGWMDGLTVLFHSTLSTLSQLSKSIPCDAASIDDADFMCCIYKLIITDIRQMLQN
jgi:hypothetical protein